MPGEPAAPGQSASAPSPRGGLAASGSGDREPLARSACAGPPGRAGSAPLPAPRKGSAVAGDPSAGGRGREGVACARRSWPSSGRWAGSPATPPGGVARCRPADEPGRQPRRAASDQGAAATGQAAPPVHAGGRRRLATPRSGAGRAPDRSAPDAVPAGAKGRSTSPVPRGGTVPVPASPWRLAAAGPRRRRRGRGGRRTLRRWCAALWLAGPTDVSPGWRRTDPPPGGRRGRMRGRGARDPGGPNRIVADRPGRRRQVMRPRPRRAGPRAGRRPAADGRRPSALRGAGFPDRTLRTVPAAEPGAGRRPAMRRRTSGRGLSPPALPAMAAERRRPPPATRRTARIGPSPADRPSSPSDARFDAATAPPFIPRDVIAGTVGDRACARLAPPSVRDRGRWSSLSVGRGRRGSGRGRRRGR